MTKWNPFNPDKVLMHLDYWSSIEAGDIPPPLCVQISPTNLCNLRCAWCMAEKCHEGGLANASWSPEFAEAFPALVAHWNLRSLYFTGGGEPTLYPGFKGLVRGITEASPETQLAMFTNGSQLHRYVEEMGYFEWLGLGVDAAHPETYRKLKGRDDLARVHDNIRAVHGAWPHLELTYKYLIYPGNIHEIVDAAEIARDLGCRYIHFRPASPRWWEDKRSQFTPEEAARARHDINNAIMAFDDPGTFDVIGAHSKYTANWKPAHRFKHCKAMGMYLTVEADHTGLLCCDRRGDEGAYLVEKPVHPDLLRIAWGSTEHLSIMAHVDVDRCPKCTMANANEAYENFILNDNTWAYFL